MKKIISAFLVAVMIIASIAAMIPISAAEMKGSYTPDWAVLKDQQKYIAYDKNGNEYNLVNYHKELTTTRESNLLSANRKSSGGEVSYISKIYFKITATTKYEYDVMVQSHTTNKYGGVPFAISTDNKVYFLYGAFNNKNDSDSTNYPNYSYAIGAHGGYENKCTSSNDQANPKFFQKCELDSEGFATLRFIYDGLTVTVMVKNSAGKYVQIGDEITLESGSKVAMGIYSRNGDTNNNRTVGIKNAVVTGLNEESVTYMQSTGVDVDVEIVETEEPGVYDSTELEAAIEEAQALKEVEWTGITYKMVMNAVTAAEALLESGTATQSEIDAKTADILTRINELVPSGIIAEDEEEEDVDTDVDADGDASEENTEEAPDASESTPATTAPQPAPNAPVVSKKGKSCKSAVGTTALVLGIVGAFGTAIVFKKKD